MSERQLDDSGKTATELRDIRRADAQAAGFTRWTWRDQIDPRSRQRILRFLRQLRRLEYLGHRPGLRHRLAAAVLWRVHLRDAARYGFTVPPNVCGPGLNIAHFGPVVINEHATIGRNCRIHPGAVVGASLDGVPRVGDDVYIGAGAKISGPITIGDGAVIAPNAVVVRDVPANCVVGGIPAKVIRRDVAYTWRP